MSADPATVLALLKDPNMESRQLAELTGTPREEAARAARMVVCIAKAKPEETVSLPAPLAAAVARAAFQGNRGDILAALAAHSNREVAKEAKRDLYVLKTRGVSVPEPQRPAAPPPPVQSPEPTFPCYASGVDGEGERAVWLARNIPGRGVELGQAVTSDLRGLIELQLVVVGRKEYRTFGQDIAAKGKDAGVTEIPRQRAHSLIVAARQLNDTSGHRVPEGADLWLARLGPTAPLEDPTTAFPTLSELEQQEALAASEKLHDLPLFHSWEMESSYLRELTRAMQEIEVSPLYLDDQQRGEQIKRTLENAVHRYLEEESRRQRLSQRLFSNAQQLQALNDAPNARIAAAVARAIAAGGDGSTIPFVRALVEKIFWEAMAHEAALHPPETDQPLIIAPR